MKCNIVFANYKKEFEFEVLNIWRKSFNKAMGIEEDTRQEAVTEHLEFLQSINPDFIRVALEENRSKIIGFMRKEENEFLSLSTFELNKGAQKFYEIHDFVITRHGFASFEDNPWATNKEQLADITYEWARGED